MKRIWITLFALSSLWCTSVFSDQGQTSSLRPFSNAFNIQSMIGQSLQFNTIAPQSTGYPYAGILPSSGFGLSSPACTGQNNGYCLFSASQTTTNRYNLNGPKGDFNVNLALNAAGQTPIGWGTYPITGNRFIYVVNNVTPNLWECTLNAGTGLIVGTMGDAPATAPCLQTARAYPSGGNIGAVWLDPTGANAYLTPSGVLAPFVTICPIDSTTGLIDNNNANCSGQTDPSLAITSAPDIAFNPAGTYAYLATPGTAITGCTGAILKCAVSSTISTSTLNNCVCSPAAGGIAAGPIYRMAVNPQNTYIYLADFNSGIFVCAINPTDGTLSQCRDVDPGTIFTGNVLGIALNSAGTFLYTTQDNGRITYCAVNSSTGGLLNCTVTGPAITDPIGIQINSQNLQAYFPNGGNLQECPLNSNGSISTTCTIPAGNPNITETGNIQLR